MVKEPQPNQDYYGEKVSTDETTIMGKALASLVQEINYESFTTYPTGFYKQITLTQKDLEKLKSIVEECTDKSWNHIQEENTAFYNQFGDSIEESYAANNSYVVLPSENLKYSDLGQKIKC